MLIVIITISTFLLKDNKFYIGFTGMGKLMAMAMLVINENLSLPVLVLGIQKNHLVLLPFLLFTFY